MKARFDLNVGLEGKLKRMTRKHQEEADTEQSKTILPPTEKECQRQK
jgi:hypothetical protein